jgi:hypothetical protein
MGFDDTQRSEVSEGEAFQHRVQPWMMECFGAEISADKLERNDRFIEEALELVQSTGYSADRAHALVDYVFGRDIGEPSQEVGGVMVTLAALCLAHGLDMHIAGETELARINQPAIVQKIRAKQAAKPTGSALPIAPPKPEASALRTDTERLDALQAESWDLRCFPIPTGGGDADIGWRCVGHWMADPQERIVGEVYRDDVRAAIDAALTKEGEDWVHRVA